MSQEEIANKLKELQSIEADQVGAIKGLKRERDEIAHNPKEHRTLQLNGTTIKLSEDILAAYRKEQAELVATRTAGSGRMLFNEVVESTQVMGDKLAEMGATLERQLAVLERLLQYKTV